MTKTYRIGLIPGDGIGPEVTAQSKRVLETLSHRFGFKVRWETYPFGAERYLATGETMPHEALKDMENLDALLLGAIGDPRVPPGILERGILLTLRFHFNQYVNLRPVNSYGLPGPLGPVDAVVVRENTEDLYVGVGGAGEGAVNLPLDIKRGAYEMKGQLSAFTSPPKRFAMQVAWHTFEGAERICRYTFDMALDMGKDRVVLASKSNAVKDLYGIFEEACRSVAREYESVSLSVENVDALCYRLVRSPASYGIILCPNMFGDIVSDLLAALGGGMGIAPSGNIGDGLCMFEPVHGSAPDIAGKDLANPLGSILSSAMMLEQLGETKAAKALKGAVRDYLSGSSGDQLPVEMGGTLGTQAVGDRILDMLERIQ
ncbi:MAG: isocitrate/isopropylmalate dehydrogenase family protein [Thermanaerothrix sp.]|nr:isocitrate/isopropylmalate dehydrogenase family protein [Thermanaerothrix sp.]